MALEIPPVGEMIDGPGPQNDQDIYRVLGGDNVGHLLGDDGSTWWYLNPALPNAELNPRANRFLGMRLSGDRPPNLYGKVLYVSPDETKRLNHKRDVWVPIRGKTFHVKEALKAIGARWDPNQRVWIIPQSKLAQAEEIVCNGKGP
jgi:hypothetical protein